MSSHDCSEFQPTPPNRTSTIDSQNSTESTGQFSSSTSAAVSPTSRGFFGVITERLRERSRSRSRIDASQKRAEPPIVLPPEPFSTARPQQTRLVSQYMPTQTSAKTQRPSLQENSRSSSGASDPWRGRHSNDWLFNGFSFRDTAREAFERRKS